MVHGLVEVKIRFSALPAQFREQIFYEPVHPYTKKLSDMARKLYQVPEKKRTGEVILRTQGLGRSFVKNSLFGKSRSLEAVEPLSFEIHKV